VHEEVILNWLCPDMLMQQKTGTRSRRGITGTGVVNVARCKVTSSDEVDVKIKLPIDRRIPDLIIQKLLLIFELSFCHNPESSRESLSS